jgi:predicted transcriptional regulator
MMQLMHDKGMLIRDESSRSHIYDTQLASSEIRNHFLKDMVNSVFDGNTSKLLIQALGSYKPSKEEIEEIKTILNNLEKNDGTAADTE